MRVIAGVAGGRKLMAPPGEQTRPTPARVREALFSSLAPYLAGARVLDLFAGSGALAIEALSRGAASATLVEASPKAARVVRQNLLVLPPQLQQAAVVLVDKAARAIVKLAATGEQFDLVFLDAPFAAGLLPPTLALLAEHKLVAQGGCIAVEHLGKDPAPEAPPGFVCARSRRYGEVALASYVGYKTELSLGL